MSAGAILVTGGVAGSAPHSTTSTVAAVSTVSAHAPDRNALPYPGTRPRAKFYDDLQVAAFIIPLTGCPQGHPNCQWMLFMNEPRLAGQPVVGEAIGTSGQLTLSYPDYCGTVQIDVLIGPAPWSYVSGLTHKIFGCLPPPTTTTTTSTSTTSTTSTSTTTSTTSTTTTTTTQPAPPVVAANNTTPTDGSSKLPFTDAPNTAASNTGATSPAMVDGSSTLPFTGSNVSQLAILGSLLILIGAALLFGVESRRRALAHSAVVRLDQLKDGARETGNWFFGS